MNKENIFIKIKNSHEFVSILSSVFAIIIGIIFGFVLLVILKPESSLYGITNMLTTGFSSVEKLGKVFYVAMPIIMTGLSVAFAFKTGLFNIGTPGQYVLGGFFALYVAIVFNAPWWLALFASIIGGALWGAIPGIFKAFFNVNEVITSIMLNWIGLYFANVCIANTEVMLNSYYGGSSERTVLLSIANSDAILPKLGLDKIFSGSNLVSIGIIIAIIVAIVSFIVLEKTIFGYELKACGYNKMASKYAGINEKRNIIFSMAIAGALAGLGGGLYYLNGGAVFTLGNVLPAAGFNGIPVALLASSNPLGVIFSALFVSYIQVGGDAMQPEYSPEAITIIISVIIYLSAFSLVIKKMISNLFRNKENKEVVK